MILVYALQFLASENERERIDCQIEFYATLYKIAGNTTISCRQASKISRKI